MQQPGEYAQPLTRSTEVRVPVVAGFTTARLRTVQTVSSGTTFSDASTQALIANVGDSQVTVRLRESADYTDGPFSDFQAVTVVPKGQVTFTIFPKQRYLELRGVSGTGEVNMRLSSQVRFETLGFDKTDPAYPSAIWAANQPGWSSL